MRKSMAVIAAFIIGISTCSSEMTAIAVENKEGSTGSGELLKKGVSEEESLLGNDFISVSDMNLKKNKDLLKTEQASEQDLSNNEKISGSDSREKEAIVAVEKKTDGEEDEFEKEYPVDDSHIERQEREDLQIPQKLEVVIDPWEMDGKSQIYSERYTIRNMGESAGVLTLSQLTCKAQEKSDVVVRTDKNGLHDNEEKALYMEILFDNGESVVLSEEGAKYRVELKPGEEVVFWFAGEVNEYATDGWGNEDIKVGIEYSWNEESDADGIDEDEINQVSNMDKESINEDSKNEDTEDSEITGEEEELPRIDGFVTEQQSKEDGGNIIKEVDLQTIQKSKMVIDSWTIEENDQKNKITSEEYVLRNTGEMTGTLILDNLRCRTQELSGIVVQTDKNGLYNSEGKAIYMEMVSGDGERMVLSQDGSGYEMELEPGEELSIRFVGEMNENISEEPEKGIAEVTAVCSWNIEIAK